MSLSREAKLGPRGITGTCRALVPTTRCTYNRRSGVVLMAPYTCHEKVWCDCSRKGKKKTVSDYSATFVVFKKYNFISSAVERGSGVTLV